jgi:hypothetical protein
MLAAAFLLYGLVAVVLLALVLPPFQNADEPNNFLRAVQIADGGLVGRRAMIPQPDGHRQLIAGGRVDRGVMAAFRPFSALVFHPETRAAPAMWAPAIGWSAARGWEGFPNSALYPPTFYLPAALAVGIGRAGGLAIVQTLVLARILTGTLAVAVGAVAILCAGPAAVWLFALLTLPMPLSLMASVTQDPLLLAATALATAMLVRGLRGPPLGRAARAALVGALCLVAMARPPYAPLAVLPLLVAGGTWRGRLIAAATVVASAAGWSAISAATALTNYGYFLGADPAAQAALLLHDPLAIARVACATLSLQWWFYLASFVGMPGWLDTWLPDWYYWTAVGLLGLAGVAASLGTPVLQTPTLETPTLETPTPGTPTPGTPTPGTPTLGTATLGTATAGTAAPGDAERRGGVLRRLVVGAAVLASAAGVFGIQYLTWTGVGHATVEGVQGRYFLPLAMVAGAMLPTFARPRLHAALSCVVAAFPLVSLGVTIWAIVARFYLS